ncbi:MAG: A/G-specific adenine glycosylase [Acidimicrobiia bacterium]|nr:A/G-specific adenine glycosylase [Acidimicrobiia bacterium]
MCQQTQASRVVPRYERFIHRWPDERALAAASPAGVLAEWSGLGYNRRALNLRRAAEVIVTRGWPTTAAELKSLPGVGPYTAAAVACFAFGEPVAAIDTNLRRVLSRWAGEPLDGALLGAAAAGDIATDRAADWNQAVMDLGALVCTPAAPACGDCPVTDWCADPGVYEPPRPQGRFDGSSRQARGAVIRTLVASGPQPVAALAKLTGMARPRVASAVAALASDGLVVRTDAGLALPEKGPSDGLG